MLYGKFVEQNQQPQIPTNPTPQQQAEYPALVDVWTVMDSQASKLIMSRCDSKPADAMEDISGAFQRWIKLKKEYTSAGLVLWHTKLQDLFNTRHEMR